MFHMADNSMLVLYNKDNAQELAKLDLRVYNAARTLISAPEEHRTNKPLGLSHFPLFSLAASLGFKKITYNATTNGVGDGPFFWIEKQHASLIGQALACKKMDCFGIEFTTVMNAECWRVLADEAKGATVKELYLTHKTGDEETPATCAALAYLCTKLKVQTVHLWSTEFEAGAIDAFASSLVELGNKTIQAVDICDISIPPPADEIRHKKLDEFVARNRD